MNKKIILEKCHAILQSKIDGIQMQLSDLRISAESESKSTSGDKHETGRAMIHLEQEQLTKQLGELNHQLSQLQQMKHIEHQPNVYSGSFVTTDQGYFFFGVSLGKVEIEGDSVMVISLVSPLGKLFLGKTINDPISFANRTYRILSVE